MTTPPPPLQQRRLVRARDLASFREALVDCALEGDPISARWRAVLVPTRAAAELLRQTIELRLGGSRPLGVLLPDFLTRADLLDRLQSAVPGRPRLLGRPEREVLLERAARATAARPRLNGAPFPLRPGLVAAMLDFYDELRRRQRTVRRMAGALFERLKVERGTDRGSEGLIHQTCFLGLSFLAYERAVGASGAIDEHGLRERLLNAQPDLPYRHLVVGVADHPSDPRGLWPADFDLFGRLRGLERIDIVVTDGAHDAGFRERLEAELPGIEEDRRTAAYPSPVLVRPPGDDDDAMCFVSRDREEELREVARAIRGHAAGTDGVLRERTAVVFHRPLPYLYLSQQVLAEARVPYQAFDALPLAAEPYAALLDVVMTVARTGGTRESIVELLRSRLLRLTAGKDAEDVTAHDASALDLVLTERRSSGDATTFVAEVGAAFRHAEGRRSTTKAGALRAARAAETVAALLRPFREATTAAAQVRAISAFLRRHERLPETHDQWRERHLRARGAVLGALDALAEAFERHDNRSRAEEDVTAAIRHAIEGQTFTPRRGAAGVHVVDAVAARFGEFDHVHVVGLVETDWPERPRRNIFYTSGLLGNLGWPQETDQARVERAAFADLLGLAGRTIHLSAFQLEGDAIVALSPMVELARDVHSMQAPPGSRRRVFDDEVVTTAPVAAVADGSTRTSWLELRHARPDFTAARYGGSVGAQRPQRYRVSRVDHYVDCPFKYFAENVLGLPEERDESAGLSPLERGMLVHSLFEAFYRDWDRDPGGTITAAALPDALARFTVLTEAALARMPEADRVLERTRLLGSLVSSGIAERVFELEADAGGEIERRLLESDLRGPFDFPQLGGLKTRTIEIAGKADRIDVFAGGAIRVVDYKLSRLPDRDASVQIAVYAHAARALLERNDRRPYRIDAAMYLAFGEDEFEGSLGNRDRRAEDVVRARVEVFAGVIDRIERGEFPARPRRVDMCGWCRYAGVCRKEYRAETDESTEPV